MYRNRKYQQKKREEEKKHKKHNWHKKGGADQFFMIPATQNSVLKKEMEACIKDTNISTKIKVIERPGNKLVEEMKNNMKKHEQKVRCEDTNRCMICREEKGGDCRKNEVIYQISCVTCEKEKKRRVYIGESHRNGISRSEEHMRDTKATKEEQIKKSVMLRHDMEEHSGEEAEYRMKVLKSLSRMTQ